MDKTVNRTLDSFKFTLPIEQNQSMEVAIADMSDNSALQASFFQVLLGFVDKFWQPRNWHTKNCMDCKDLGV